MLCCELAPSVRTDHHVTLQTAGLPWRDGTASQATSTSEQVEVSPLIPELYYVIIFTLVLCSSYYLQGSKCTNIVSLYFGRLYKLEVAICYKVMII